MVRELETTVLNRFKARQRAEKFHAENFLS